jgi:hypothetical protein
VLEGGFVNRSCGHGSRLFHVSAWSSSGMYDMGEDDMEYNLMILCAPTDKGIYNRAR